MLRLNSTFRVSYDSDIDRAKEVLSGLLAADDRILLDSPARVFVQQLADSSVELVAWLFVQTEHHALLQAETVEQAKKVFDAAGIVIPYPQQDVHLRAYAEELRTSVRAP